MKRLNIKRICLISVAAVALATALTAKADVTTPYSMYGYGILGDRATSMQNQMGGIGFAMQSGRQVNVMNPASYAAIDSLTFLFDMGADIDFLFSREKSLTTDAKNRANSIGGGLNYVTMQFPLGKYMGGSIGLLPYSSVGYAFGNEIAHGAVENQGRGGINLAYLGVAGRYAGFSVGANVSYSFGNIINDVYATPSNSGQTLTEHVMEIRDWDIQLGVQYAARLSKTNTLTFGFSYTPKKSLHGNSWVTHQEIKMESLPDTVGQLKLKGNYYTPNMYGVGVSFRHERQSRWMVEADFSLQQWSKAKYSAIYETDRPENMVFSGMQFADRVRYAVGGEWVPKVRGNYGERTAYRLGAYYCDDYLKINGNRVREYGISMGVGLHAPSDKTMINVGLEWKCRQAHPQKLISENYFNITVGVNFNELWFWQRKIK